LDTMQTKTRMKGQALTIGAIPAVVLTFVLIGFYLSFGALITNDLGSTLTAGSAAKNATVSTQEALTTFSSRLPLLALVVFFAVILSVIAVLAATGRISV
jgi:flagellar biosynthesis protein FlhB